MLAPGSEGGGSERRGRGFLDPIFTRRGLAAAIAVLIAAIVFVAVSHMRPAYDAFGWMVWGRQALHWNLDLNGAPSWKPLAFLFTFPFALAGRGQMWLWMVTAVAGAFGGAAFAARIAYRLTGPSRGRAYAPIIAAVLAAVGILGLGNYWQLILISNVDPLITMLCLAAIDSHLAGRPRAAFVLLVLAALGRPELWLFVGLYALWAWRAIPSMRVMAALGVALIPLLWFGIPALTAKSWFISGDLALNSRNVLHGDKFGGVISRFVALSVWPMDVAALCALGLAAIRRDRVALLLAGAAFLWVAVEIGFAYHGWSAAPRYMFEPAAVMVVLASAGVGRILAAARTIPLLLRVAGPVAVALLLAALITSAPGRVRDARGAFALRRGAAKEVDRLEDVIRRSGGAGRIRRCGQPVTFVGLQSTLAWEVGMNVGYVGYKPGKAISKGIPIVLFRPHEEGWEERPIHTRAGCGPLWIDTKFG
jgi:hypothetical protein